MPKQSLDTEVDGEWVGRSVMLKPARGKRLPETMVAKICRVTRHATNAAVLLEYSANGTTKTYTDIFLCLRATSRCRTRPRLWTRASSCAIGATKGPHGARRARGKP